MYKIIGADGHEYGPVAADLLRQWVAEGRANAQTKVLPQGASEWKRLAQIPDFAEALRAAAPPAVVPGPMAPASVAAHTNPLASAGLVLGILSVTICLCCYGLPFNLAGIICSAMALSQIKNDNGRGKGLAITGLVLSLLSLLLGVVVLVVSLTLDRSELIRRIQNF